MADFDTLSDTASATSGGISMASVTTSNSTTINPLLFTSRRLPSITDQAANVFLRIDISSRISDMHTIKHKGKTYILEDWIHKRTARSSWIGAHGY
ncbi:hypothetical protein B0T25DRAFT_278881 [Lasiosphaeria hispida]|uniref:Uncharacterized protein n=1 Tax=Lasiosphaeria hispida TaxID=260671 RepID=A0AAJ0MAN2_9PEZI|nr:hypothetical protein B0T25DRAFT_278881 [Lasiosphaeria hispida]